MIIFVILLIGLLSALFISEKEKITQTEQYEMYLGADGKYKENYFGYLLCEYSQEEFDEEVARLNSLESEPYIGVYGIKEFPYDLCAVYADETYGVIYALADEEEKEIIYVALEFCNYFTDIDYKEMMDEKYLPVGFDAMPGNDKRKEFDRR